MNKSRVSIQRHLVVYLTTTTIVLFGLSALGLYFYMRHAFYEQLDGNLEHLAEEFISETERRIDGGVECEFEELDLESFRKKDSGKRAYYELIDHRGKVLIRSASLAADEKLPRRRVSGERFIIEPFNAPGMAPGRIIFASFSIELDDDDDDDLDPGDLAEMAARTPSEKAYVDSYDKEDPKNITFLAITENTSDLKRTLFMLALGLSVTGMVLVGVTLLLVPKIVRNACRPMLEIAKLTGQMGADNLDVQLPVMEMPIEIRPIIVKFNQFIERLDASIQKERRFSRNLAHELRTPVTEIRSLMEVAADTSDKDTAITSQEIYHQGAMISQRMSRIIEVLSAIHQGGEQAVLVASVPQSIGLALARSIAVFASQTQTRFNLGESNYEKIVIDPELLRAVIDNLLMNAVVHSPDNSQISVFCHADGFSIVNTTTDLEQADLAFLKEPFWQQDAARSDPDRFGLGLTLVAVYLRLLNGGIEHKLEVDKLTTKVTLPKRVTSG